MKATGLRLRIKGEELIVHPRCTDDPTKLGRHDFVIVALKPHQVYGNPGALHLCWYPRRRW